MPLPTSLLERLAPGLPRSVWLLQVGGFANAFGNGIAFPFLLIYLHNVRGVSLGVAGLIAATNAVVGMVAGPAAGVLVDRLGSKRVLGGALVLLAVGFGSYSLVHEAWQGFLSAGLAGIGNGAFWPAHSSLIGGLTVRERRHAAYALQRVSNNLGIGLGGVAGGLIASTGRPGSFTVLFLVDAATFLVFAGVLARISSPDRFAFQQDTEARAVEPGRYIDVLRHGVFVRVVLLNALFISVGYGMFDLLPVFAKNNAGVSERQIGVIFLANTLLIVLVQMPVTRRLEGRRRMPAFAGMGLLFGLSWLVVLGGGLTLEGVGATIAFSAALAIFGLGECIHGTIQTALAVDLARPDLMGRYMALSAFSWQLGLAVGPAAGGFLLAASPTALWLSAAAVCGAGSVSSLLLERRLPREALRTPAAALA